MQTRVSSKGQIVLPKEVRRRLGIHMGDALQITVDPDHAHVILTPKRGGKPTAVIIDDPVTGWRFSPSKTSIQIARSQFSAAVT